MKKSLLGTIGKGILIGAFLFFIPTFLLLFFLLFALIPIFFFSRMRGGNFGAHKLAFADKVRSMSEEDYSKFKTNTSFQHFSRGCSRTK
jgi:hypothetical protein